MQLKLVFDREGKFVGIKYICPGCALEEGGGHFRGYNFLPISNWLPQGKEKSIVYADKHHWTFDGNLDNPTFTPSVKTENGKGFICHSIITSGKISFCSDSTHSLAGQIIDLPNYIEEE